MTVVTDGVNLFKFPDTFVANKNRDEVNKGLAEAFLSPAPDMIAVPYTPVVINTGSKLVVIDTGTGEANFERSKGAAGQFTNNLKASGIDRSQVDTVIISHFHGDHINGLLTADNKPAYPNAEILVPAAEWRYFTDDAEMGKQTSDRMKGVFSTGVVTDACSLPKTDTVQTNVSFKHVDGRETRVAMNGERQYGWGERASTCHYQLGPMFRIGRDEAGLWWVTVRIYVRVTDIHGTPFQLKDIVRRRKAVTRSWWNKEWLARLLGVMQALRTNGTDIQIGSGQRAVTVSSVPLEWNCPVSIDVAVLERIGDLHEEMAAIRHADAEEQEGGEPNEGALDE